MKSLNINIEGKCHPSTNGNGLLPGWSERLKEVGKRRPSQQSQIDLPRSPGFYSHQLVFVDTRKSVEALVELCEQRPLSHIGFDTEFKFHRPPVRIDKRTEISDPRCITPLLLSLSLAEPCSENKGRLYNFVVDLRRPEVVEQLGRVFQLPVTFVGHFVKVEFFCFWQLGLSEPSNIWDTWVNEKALYLGINHRQYKTPRNADDAEDARTQERIMEDEEFSYSLVGTCQRYSVRYAFAKDKVRLQKSFLSHNADQPFSKELIRYSAEDSVAAARLYLPQVQAAAASGILKHLVTVEMPWTVTNAWIEWNGIRVDDNKKRKVLNACRKKIVSLEKRLQKLGIENCRSHKQLKEFFVKEGLLDLFRRNGKYSFDKDQLRRFSDNHPSIPFIRAARRAHDLISGKILGDELIGADGRMHPQHKHLGAHTGRQTSKHPNLLGLDRVLRPLIVPEDECGIGEADWSQIEIGISAAVYKDERLLQMFNSGDVYSKMAMTFFESDLSEKDRKLSTTAFKKKHSHLRNHMKACTLGIIYGMTPFGLARFLDIKEIEAKDLQRRFFALFPSIGAALTRSVQMSAIRGCAVCVSGLRRHRSGTGRLTSWERNWLTNYPVQGSGAVILKAAGNRLRKLYGPFKAKILVPFHDSVVFEVPLESLQAVADLTARVMCETVQEYFPELKPQVDINIKDPSCWNKDGHSDSIDKFVKNLTYNLDAI